MAGSRTPPFDTAVGNDESRALLAAHGLRATTPRLAVLAVLRSLPAPGHISAPQLRQRLAELGVEADMTTAYRTLATLTDADIVHALPIPEKATVYGLAQRPHHHAVCRGCGDVVEIPAGDIAFQITGDDFMVEPGHAFVLTGLCGACRRNQQQ